MARDGPIERGLAVHGFFHQHLEQIEIAFTVGVGRLSFARQLASGEIGEDLCGGGARYFHLVKSLHRPQARGAASGRIHTHRLVSARRRFNAIMASAARAASPPLSPRAGSARTSAWARFSTVRMP